MTQTEMKKAAAAALEANDFETILTLARQSRKVLSVLVRLAYDKDTLVGRRAIAAIGPVASLFVRNNYEFLRETVRKLLWSLSDESGGIGWSAPEILGEIVRADPRRFNDVIPLLAELFSIEEKVFRPGVLYAFGRIAEIDAEAVLPFQEVVIKGLFDEDPLTRINALKLAGMLHDRLTPENRQAAGQAAKQLIQDRREAWIYKEGRFVGLDVGEAAEEIYGRLAS